MTTGGIIAVGFLLVMVGLILLGIRGHGHVDKSGADCGMGPDDTGSGD
jgi:hypothetical protein